MSVETLTQWLKQSSSTVILTGAGMSTESGIPDFRSVSGWWQNIDPRTVASVESLHGHYARFCEFYTRRYEALQNCTPHKGHAILADWEQRGLISLVATQNVDQFHQQAGSKEVAELHGNIVSARCNACTKPHTIQHFLNHSICTYCSGKLRPNVVLFGESLPQEAWNRSFNEIKNADIVVVIGTSLEVYPVNELPDMARGKLVYINLEVTDNRRDFDLVLEGSAGELLAEVDKALAGYSKD